MHVVLARRQPSPGVTPARWSARRLLHQGGDLLLHRGVQLHERVGHRPQVPSSSFAASWKPRVEYRYLNLPESWKKTRPCRPRRVRGHPVPGLRRQVRRGRGHRRRGLARRSPGRRAPSSRSCPGRLQPVGLLGTLLALGPQLGGALLHRGPLLGGPAVRAAACGRALRRHVGVLSAMGPSSAAEPGEAVGLRRGASRFLTVRPPRPPRPSYDGLSVCPVTIGSSGRVGWRSSPSWSVQAVRLACPTS